MLDLLNAIMNSQQGGAVNQLSRQFNLDQNQTQSALQALVPALAAGLKQNASSPTGLQNLIGALSTGRHDKYVENPNLLEDPSTREEGNSILGHILGSKDVSRSVASQASEQTGISSDILKQMLPLVATMAMGAMSKQQNVAAAAPGAGVSGASGILGMLTPLLDKNRDGSVLDDVLGMASGFFGKR